MTHAMISKAAQKNHSALVSGTEKLAPTALPGAIVYLCDSNEKPPRRRSVNRLLMLKGEQGALNGFTIETASAATSPSAAPGDLTYLDWYPVGDSGQLRQQAQDAAFLFDTIAMTSASNRVSDLPEGIELNLAATR